MRGDAGRGEILLGARSRGGDGLAVHGGAEARQAREDGVSHERVRAILVEADGAMEMRVRGVDHAMIDVLSHAER